MNTQTPPGPPEHFLKDGRAAYMSLLTLSAYAAVTLLGATDAELFGGTRQIELPILGVEMSAVSFLWIATAVMAILCLFLHVLAVNMTRALPAGLTEERTRQIALETPIYLRWIFCLLETGRGLGGQYLASLIAAYALPAAGLAFLWWRSHVMHAPGLSAFIAACLLSLPVAHLMVRALVGETSSRTGRLTAAVVVALLGILGLGWLTQTRTDTPQNSLFARADLNRGALIARPDTYVPRFVWARAHLAAAGLTDPRDPRRAAIEDEWFDRRQYQILNGAPLRLDGVDLRGARMNHAYLAGIYLRGADLSNAILTRADMESIDASRTDFVGANLSGAHLEQGYFFASDFARSRMQDARLEESLLTCADFTGAQMPQSTLDGAFMDKAVFQDAALAGASLRGAYAKRADFRGADLTGADLSGTIFWAADLSTAKGLTQAQLDRAIGDADTRLPEGLSLRSCAASIPVQPLPYRQQWWLKVPAVKDHLLCATSEGTALTPSATCP